MTTRPTPSLLDIISTLLFWLGILCYGVGQFCVALIGLGLFAAILSPPIMLVAWMMVGFRPGFLNWFDYLDFCIWPLLGVIGVWAGAILLALLLSYIGKRVSPDLDIWHSR